MKTEHIAVIAFVALVLLAGFTLQMAWANNAFAAGRQQGGMTANQGGYGCGNGMMGGTYRMMGNPSGHGMSPEQCQGIMQGQHADMSYEQCLQYMNQTCHQ